jgi:L-fuconolactonase
MPAEEPALDPERPIIDPHLHLWDIGVGPRAHQEPQTFLLPDALAMLDRSGHDVTHTVFLECNAMYRREGPPELRPVGETEFANGVAAMSASGRYGPRRIAHRIVSHADLSLGEAVRPVLEAHLARAGERFRGVRGRTAYSEAPMFGMPSDPARRGMTRDPRFRAGAAVLAEMGLSLDVWCVHTQLDELIEFADALPDLAIVLDHIGTPESQGAWAGREAEARREWAAGIAELARRPNVSIKLGGMGMDFSRPVPVATGTATSQELAERWQPYVETCIAAFSPHRAMFESNFPPDKAAGSYGATWNAFKRIAADYSDDEKDALFRRTAARFYRIELD